MCSKLLSNQNIHVCILVHNANVSIYTYALCCVVFLELKVQSSYESPSRLFSWLDYHYFCYWNKMSKGTKYKPKPALNTNFLNIDFNFHPLKFDRGNFLHFQKQPNNLCAIHTSSMFTHFVFWLTVLFGFIWRCVD